MLVKTLGTACAVAAGIVSVAFAAPTAVIDEATKTVTLTVPEGYTNTLGECANVDAVVAAINGNVVTNVVKAGRGGLIVGHVLDTYGGIFTIAEGTYLINCPTALGPSGVAKNKVIASYGCSVYVKDGATLDNYGGYDIGRYRRIYFEGFGVDGVGALVSSASKNVTGGTWGALLEMTGDALIADTSSTRDRTLVVGVCDDLSYFDWHGHTLYARTYEGVFQFRDSCRIKNPGDFVPLGTTTVYMDGFLTGSGHDAYAGKRYFVGPQNRVELFNTRTAGTDWTLVWSNANAGAGAQYFNKSEWDTAFKTDDTNTRRVWRGPVELYTDMNAETACMNLSFKETVSGAGGFIVNSKPFDGHNGPGELHLSAVNSFAGGVVATNTRVVAWKQGALPNGSDVRLANGSSLELKGEQTLALGDGAFDGAVAVKGGVGTWRSFTKTGDGVLTYQSSLGASTLDVRGGGVVLDDVSESTVALQTRGLVVGHKFFPSYAAGWQNLTNSTETYVHAIETQLSAANDWYAKEWSEYEGEEYGPCLVVVYSGYLNVSSPTNEVWSFIGGVASASRLLIGDEEVFLQPNTSNAAIASRTMTPGLHKFQLRLFYQGYNHSKAGGAPAGGPSATPTNVVKVSTVSVGFQVDKLGRGSNVLADYKLLSDTAGETFRWGSLADDPVLVHPLTGESVTATLQAPFRAFSAAPGTTVTSLSSATRIFETLAGFTDFAGADVEIRTAWTVDGADLASADACFATAEAVAFGEGAELRLVNPNGYRGHGKTFTVMTAEKGIAGLPSLVVEDGSKARWALGKSADGKSLVLTRIPPGLTVTVR